MLYRIHRRSVLLLPEWSSSAPRRRVELSLLEPARGCVPTKCSGVYGEGNGNDVMTLCLYAEPHPRVAFIMQVLEIIMWVTHCNIKLLGCFAWMEGVMIINRCNDNYEIIVELNS